MKTLPLHGKIVTMTGALSVTRDQFAILLEDAGAVVATSLSKQVDILIVGAEPGSLKLTQARTNGTAIWDEAKTRDVMAGGKGLYTQKVWGSSDDIVELSGGVETELDGGDEPIYLRFTNGTYLKIVYTNEGLWRIEVLAAGRGKLRKLFAMPDDRDVEEDGPNPQAHSDKDAPVYSDVLIIDSEEPIELESWDRKPLGTPVGNLSAAKEVFKALERFDGFEFFTHELEQTDYNAALAAVAKVVDAAVQKAMND